MNDPLLTNTTGAKKTIRPTIRGRLSAEDETTPKTEQILPCMGSQRLRLTKTTIGSKIRIYNLNSETQEMIRQLEAVGIEMRVAKNTSNQWQIVIMIPQFNEEEANEGGKAFKETLYNNQELITCVCDAVITDIKHRGLKFKSTNRRDRAQLRKEKAERINSEITHQSTRPILHSTATIAELEELYRDWINDASQEWESDYSTTADDEAIETMEAIGDGAVNIPAYTKNVHDEWQKWVEGIIYEDDTDPVRILLSQRNPSKDYGKFIEQN